MAIGEIIGGKIEAIFGMRAARMARAYRAAFSGPDGEVVLRDLLDFCNAGRSSIVVDASKMTLVNEGKRLVALRIAGYLNLTDEQILEISMQRTAEDE